MKNSNSFWDKNALSYAKTPIADTNAYQKKLEITRFYLRKEMTILELGCGTGSTAIAHSAYVKNIHAIDISQKMIDIAKEKAALNNINNIMFEQCDINQLKTQKESYNIIMAHSILHLLSDLSEVFSNAYNLLKKDGYFIISTMCLGDSVKLKLMSLFMSIGAYFDLLPQLNPFTTKELISSLCHAGFEIEYQWQPQKDSAVFIVAKKP
ncbi:class I SAM-dependent DNA methyltransferase [Aliikangiella sp. IMCC44359]|uniref:class I SAM-dependent DNA methyltransferase n=1 Tax=Aliikangiella sp. IMCC44359 TaxID=3459125 RepID=UPI00403B029D